MFCFFLLCLDNDYENLPVGTLRNNLASGQIQDQPPGIFLFCWEDLTPGSRNPILSRISAMQSFCRSNKGEHFLFSWEDASEFTTFLRCWIFSIPVESRQLMFPWWMLRPEPEVDLDVMHHAEDVEDDSDRVWVGHVLFKKNVTEGKRTNKEMQNFHSGDLPWRIWHC